MYIDSMPPYGVSHTGDIATKFGQVILRAEEKISRERVAQLMNDAFKRGQMAKLSEIQQLLGIRED